MKKIIIVLFIVSTAFTNQLMGQVNTGDYNFGVGLRGGFFSGFTGKYHMNATDAIEGVAAFHYRGLLIMGMYQKHAEAFETPGLNWYYGGGAFLGFYDRAYSPWYDDRDGNFTTLGVNGVLGLEYKIQEIPITIGLDVIPSLNLISDIDIWLSTGLTLRYVFRN